MVLAVAVAFTAALSWLAIVRQDHVVDLITRPTFLLLLAGLAWSLATEGSVDVSLVPTDGAPALRPVLLAIGLHVLVDALLLTATERRYLLALWILILAQVAWGWAFICVPAGSGVRWWVPLALVALALLHRRWGREVVRSAGRQRGVVLLHLLTLAGLFLVAAWQALDRLVLGGSALLLAAYLLLGHDRFVLERRWAPVLVMVAYHGALTLLVVGLLGASASS
ncbi:hypothetical protein IDVR_29440 [Intrasporangium sp. DVR]